MGKLLLAFITLFAALSLLHALPDQSPGNPQPDPSEPVKTVADPPAETDLLLLSIEESDDDHEKEESTAGEAPIGSRKMGGHHSSDKSVACGGVIIGGLVVVGFAAVCSYIRVTRRNNAPSLK